MDSAKWRAYTAQWGCDRNARRRKCGSTWRERPLELLRAVPSLTFSWNASLQAAIEGVAVARTPLPKRTSGARGGRFFSRPGRCGGGLRPLPHAPHLASGHCPTPSPRLRPLPSSCASRSTFAHRFPHFLAIPLPMSSTATNGRGRLPASPRREQEGAAATLCYTNAFFRKPEKWTLGSRFSWRAGTRSLLSCLALLWAA